MSAYDNNNTATGFINRIKELLSKPTPQVVKPSIEKPKDVTLYTQDAKLIKEYKGVYLSRWDRNIYHIYKNSDATEYMERIDKGENMLLVSKPSKA